MIEKTIILGAYGLVALAGSPGADAWNEAASTQQPTGPLIAPFPPPPPLPDVPEPDLEGPFAPDLPPRPLAPGDWITASDYPSDALREKREGWTGVRLHISETGRIDSCNVIQTSGHVDLDEATCVTLMRRARFQPATDAQGKLTGSIWKIRITWALPEDEEATRVE